MPTTAKESALYRSVEIGKMHLQNIARSLNRLAYGRHDKNGVFHLDEAGIMALKKLDTPGGLDNVKKNMNESAVKHLAPHVERLHDEKIISKDMRDTIKELAKSLVTDFDDEFRREQEYLKKTTEKPSFLDESKNIKEDKRKTSA